MIGRIFAQRYEIVELIGKGGMAMVYRAKDLHTGHSVAIKVLRHEYSQDAEFLGRFQREAEAASKMSHHNIVNLLDVGMDGDSRYLVMEYVQGKTLKELIREKGKMSPTLAAQIAIRILAAMQHAHKNGIIHRDIKPQNILVHADGHIKVADFGIARMADSSTLTKGDNVMGSVHYFSPEQASGSAATEKSDIYSVGVVLYEMLTGRVPFDGDTPVSVAMQHLRSQPQSIRQTCPDVPEKLCQVVRTAMEKEPKYRYQSALAMAQDLKLAMQEGGELIGGPAKPAQSKPQPKPAVKTSAEPGKASLQTGSRRPVKSRKQRTKQVFLWAGTLIMAGAVLFGLVMGGIAVYERIVNTTTAPDLVGLDTQAAILRAERANLNTEIIEVNHPSIAAGLVIMQTPEYDASMHKNDTVVLTVSKGPVSQTVPSITGKTSQEAVNTLQAMGLILTVTEKVVSSEIVDTVLSQIPDEGATCYAGDTVQVVVSGGSALVPDVTGRTQVEAEHLITSAGLVPGSLYEETHDEALDGRAFLQQPTASTQMIQNAQVTVTYYKFVPEYVGEITLNLPKMEGGVHVRLTLVEADGTETELYAAKHTADGSLNPVIPLEDDTPGERLVRVYLNGELAEEVPVTLQ